MANVSKSLQIDTTCTPERLRTVLTDLRQKSLQRQVPSLGQDTLARIFPLHLPWSLSVIIFWRLPDLNRQGWNCINGDDAYSAVNVSRGLLQKASATLGGGRYEESAQERARLLQQLKLSDLGRSVCPVVVSQHVSDPQAKEVVSTR